MTIRRGTVHDIPAMISVVLSCVNKDRLWLSLHPHPNEKWHFRIQMNMLFMRHLLRGDWVCEVVDLAQHGEEPYIVSVAVWDVCQTVEGKKYASHWVPPPIANTRFRAHQDMVSAARRDFLDTHPGHSFLQALATYPEERNHGHRRALVQSYVERTKARGDVLAAMAGPSGEIFLSLLGFTPVGDVALSPDMASTDSQTHVRAMTLAVEKEGKRRAIIRSTKKCLSVLRLKKH